VPRVRREKGVLSSTATTSSCKTKKGGIANIAIANVMQSNGVIHVVDRVLLSN
jgi:uncharacterized surface protein with fasciclin (FAS1) repeats